MNRRWIRILCAAFAAFVMLTLAMAPGAMAQSDKKKKKNQPPPKVDNSSANPIVPMTDEQQIDYMLSEYLGAWQLGDTERMHKFYSDDVSVVRGSWEGPILGWTNFLALYQQQRSHMQQVRLDRMNTYIKVNGTTAWTCYQWEFEAVVDGSPTMARGQTTFVLVKKDRWLIAHDHTSVVQTAKPPSGSAPSNPTGTPTPTAGQANKPPSQ